MAREQCICAAIVTVEGRTIRGHRHHDCFRTAVEMGLGVLRVDNAQGFITSENRFVGRAEGRRLQEAAGIESVGGYRGDILFSEDLY